jgi:hypothetical protein
VRRFTRRDRNEPELVTLATALGVWLIPTNWPTDFLAWFRDRWDLVEIKRPDKEGWASEYTPKQKAFREKAQQIGARLITWRTDDDVYAHVGGRRTA